MGIVLLSAISLGLLSSFHCMGMCGPIAFVLPVQNRNTAGKVMGLLTYNFGRIITYGFLGLLIGVFGEGLRFAGFSQLISIILGVALIIYVLLSKQFVKINIHNKAYLKFNNQVKSKLSGLLKKKSHAALLLTGLLNGLIPCGVVFIALQAALLQSSLLYSVLFMLVFGLGTLPMMFGISFLSSSFSKVGKIKVNRIMPFITLLVAVLLIVRGLNLDIPYLSPNYNAQENEMSCCHKPQK